MLMKFGRQKQNNVKNIKNECVKETPKIKMIDKKLKNLPI